MIHLQPPEKSLKNMSKAVTKSLGKKDVKTIIQQQGFNNI